MGRQVNGINGAGRWVNGTTIVSIVGSVISAAVVVGITYGSIMAEVNYNSAEVRRLQEANSQHSTSQRETAVAMATLGTQLVEARSLVADLRIEIRGLRQELGELRGLLYQTRREVREP